VWFYNYFKLKMLRPKGLIYVELTPVNWHKGLYMLINNLKRNYI